MEDLPNGSHVVSWRGMKLKVCIKQKKDDPWILLCPSVFRREKLSDGESQGAQKQVLECSA